MKSSETSTCMHMPDYEIVCCHSSWNGIFHAGYNYLVTVAVERFQTHGGLFNVNDKL